MPKLTGYRRRIYFSILIVALGIILSTTPDNSIGVVFIAIGGLFLISGMNEKRKETE